MSSCSILEVMEGFSFNVVRNSSTADTWTTPLASRCRFNSSKGVATSSRGSDGTTSMVMVLAAATDRLNGSATVQSWCLLLQQIQWSQPLFNHGACCCNRWTQWSQPRFNHGACCCNRWTQWSQPLFNHGACCCNRWTQWFSHCSIMVLAAATDGLNGSATVQSWCLLLQQMDSVVPAMVQSWCLLLQQMDSMVQPLFNHGACCCNRWTQWSQPRFNHGVCCWK